MGRGVGEGTVKQVRRKRCSEKGAGEVNNNEGRRRRPKTARYRKRGPPNGLPAGSAGRPPDGPPDGALGGPVGGLPDGPPDGSLDGFPDGPPDGPPDEPAHGPHDGLRGGSRGEIVCALGLFSVVLVRLCLYFV